MRIDVVSAALAVKLKFTEAPINVCKLDCRSAIADTEMLDPPAKLMPVKIPAEAVKPIAHEAARSVLAPACKAAIDTKLTDAAEAKLMLVFSAPNVDSDAEAEAANVIAVFKSALEEKPQDAETLNLI